MDKRTALSPDSILNLGGLDCCIEDVVGRGSNAIVYKGWYPDRLNPGLKHHVLIKELFPWHPTGRIYRNEEGTIVIERDAMQLWEDHKKSFCAGNEIHLRLLEKRPEALGANLNSCNCNGTLYSILGYTGGRTLESELSHLDATLRRCVLWMLDVLDALEAFHQSGYLHLDISPNNIMLTGTGHTEQIFLIDYNTAQAHDTRERIYCACNPGYSAPETELGVGSLGFSADLYSVCAVFFRCLMGRSMTLEEGLAPRSPDGSDSPLLKAQPPTVLDQVSRILRKGLNILPQKRYQTTRQLREAFSELLDRIDGIGVTHWALWECGRRSVAELIRTNPALGYLTDGQELFPIRLESEKVQELEDFLAERLSPSGSSALILAHGGMGKTTLLLHAALTQTRRYSPSLPAVLYLNLNGLDKSRSDPIKTALLMRLRFSRDSEDLAGAMRTLAGLMDRPVQTRNGPAPSVLLLLDGLNEVKNDASMLWQEIEALAATAGVRIIAASRSTMPQLSLDHVRLLPLTARDIADLLRRRGIPLPREEAVLTLLTTPLVCSLYLRSCDEDGAAQVVSEGELMDFYLSSLRSKELRILAQDSPERWQIDAALRLVLPVLAGETGYDTVDEKKLLKLVTVCWKHIRSGGCRSGFPEWTGRSGEIFGDAKNPEQWYGLVVNRILWQRMGLLIREPEGGIRIFHQNIAEHLSISGGALLRRIRMRRYTAFSGIVALIAAAALTVSTLSAPHYYEDAQAEQVLEVVGSQCCSSGYLLGELLELTELARSGDAVGFDRLYLSAETRLMNEEALSMTEESCLERIDGICQSGELVSWSGEPLDGTAAKAVLEDTVPLAAEYREMMELLLDWNGSELAQRDCPEFPEDLYRLLEADAKILSKRYHAVCVPHIQGDAAWMEILRQNAASMPFADIEPEESLEVLGQQRSEISLELTRITARVRLLCREGAD